jgi:hypothetical protein
MRVEIAVQKPRRLGANRKKEKPAGFARGHRARIVAKNLQSRTVMFLGRPLWCSIPRFRRIERR